MTSHQRLQSMSRSSSRLLDSTENLDSKDWWVASAEAIVGQPLVLGYLNMSLVDVDELKSVKYAFLARTIILQLHVSSCISRNEAIQLFPYAICINNEYIPTESFSTSPTHASSLYSHTSSLSTQQSGVLHSLQLLPPDKHKADVIKLQLLLDDYVQYAEYTSLQRLDTQPLIIMPHSNRVEFLLLLTSSIVFQLPLIILKETLILVIGQWYSSSQISSILALPECIKTALVMAIHRICDVEMLELTLLGKIRNKNKIFDGIAVKRTKALAYYLSLPIEGLSEYESTDLIPSPGYTSMQLEVLSILPRVPTTTLLNKQKSSFVKDTYHSWIAVLARQSILLLMRASSCPSLVQQQPSSFDQKNYNALLPLLSFASLTYRDMNIQFDVGRIRSLPSFGLGLPDGSVSSLRWNRGVINARYLTTDPPIDMRQAVSDEDGHEHPLARQSSGLRIKYRHCRNDYSSRPIVTKAMQLDRPFSPDSPQIPQIPQIPHTHQTHETTQASASLTHFDVHYASVDKPIPLSLLEQSSTVEMKTGVENVSLKPTLRLVRAKESYKQFKQRLFGSAVKPLLPPSQLTEHQLNHLRTNLMREMGTYSNLLKFPCSANKRILTALTVQSHGGAEEVCEVLANNSAKAFLTDSLPTDSHTIAIADAMSDEADENGSYSDSASFVGSTQHHIEAPIQRRSTVISTSYERQLKWYPISDDVIGVLNPLATATSTARRTSYPPTSRAHLSRVHSTVALERCRNVVENAGQCTPHVEGSFVDTLHVCLPSASRALRLNPGFRVTMKAPDRSVV